MPPYLSNGPLTNFFKPPVIGALQLGATFVSAKGGTLDQCSATFSTCGTL